jgi:hypothetical protein
LALTGNNIGGRLVINSGRHSYNKYGAVKTTVDGIRFDSRREAERYIDLKYLVGLGEITDLKLQVEFEVIPAMEICGRKYRPTIYRADFTYYDNGKYIVEDCKGMRTKEYAIKRKLMKQVHGIEVKES